MRNKPEGMAVPGIIFAGSMIQRSVQAGCKRSWASKKFGAIAFLSCASLPVIWHFRQGAAGLVNSARAMARSLSSRGLIFGGINGSGWDDIAWKNSTGLRIYSLRRKN